MFLLQSLDMREARSYIILVEETKTGIRSKNAGEKRPEQEVYRNQHEEKGAMETNTDGTFFQEGDQVRVKRTGEQGRVDATDGGVVYVLMAGTNESKIFSAVVGDDAYIELVTLETPVLRNMLAE